MPGIRVHDGESIEKSLKIFKRQTERAGTIKEVKKRQQYEKPSVRRKKKAAAALKRLRKQQRKLGLA